MARFIGAESMTRINYVTAVNYVTADCRVEAILKRLSQVEDVESYLSEVLDATIMAAGADMGTPRS